FFSSRRRHTRSKRDWSSDVCSSDLFLPTGNAKSNCYWTKETGDETVRTEMNSVSTAGLAVLALILLKWAVQFSLERLNQRHALAHADAVPGALGDSIDPATYAKAVEYTMAKSRVGQVEESWNTLILLAALFGGVLP